jgi:ParB-like chromosome segregation protein Spo0J
VSRRKATKPASAVTENGLPVTNARRQKRHDASKPSDLSTQPAILPEFHPLATVDPLMEGADYAVLIEDIREHGLRESIVLYQGKILDGRNRARACAEAGTEPQYKEIAFVSDADAVAFLDSVNLHRRHLTPKQKRERIAVRLKVNPTLSDRQVAKETGASHPHVAKVRRELEESGDVETVSTSIDTSGRQQPRQRSKPKTVPPEQQDDIADRQLSKPKAVPPEQQNDAAESAVAVSPPSPPTEPPNAKEPLDFEHTIEACLLDLTRRFRVRSILYDPWQMQAIAQRLTKAGLPMEEFPQSVPNLTQASQCLFDLIEAQGLVLYPDKAMRLAISRCVAIEGPRGWRIGKDKSAFKIDVIVALAMATHAAVHGAGKSTYTLDPFQDDFVDLDRRDASPPETPPPLTADGNWWRHKQHLRSSIGSADDQLRSLYGAVDNFFRYR